MIWIIRLLSAASILLSLLALGLSAMASDDLGRAGEARGLQLLVLAWLIVSIVTLLVVPVLARRSPAMVAFGALPMIVICVAAVARLARF